MSLRPLTGKAATAAALCTADINLYEGSVRSGKTVSSILKWLEFVLHGPSGDLLMVGKTERTLQRNIINPIIEYLGPARARLVAGSGELWICGRRVYLVGANNEAAQDKIRGMTLVGAYVDEVSLVPESFWTMLLSRLSVDGSRLIGTTNPDSPAHWLLRDYLSRACLWLQGDGTIVRREVDETDPAGALNLHRFSFRLTDNPTLSERYKRGLTRMYQGLWYRRFVLGEWVVAEGAVYDMWDPERHVITDAKMPKLGRMLALGVDHGISNPFSALLLGVGVERDRKTRLYLAREWRYDSRRHRKQLSDIEYSERLRGWLGGLNVPQLGTDEPGVTPERVYVDPAAAGFFRQAYNDRLTVAHAVNEVQLGIQLVSSLLSLDLLRVHESCAGWIEEVAGYCWDPDAQLKGEDKPIKLADHSLDAGRYAIASTEWTWRGLLRSELALAA
ncbi:hypothetical protein GCM10018962_77240 [Dactylosporangium matsuzakiense]|uniref:PBSX family phage terminase large subunit n=1 Tax=Dactylosporangium matsuzakiense TaxID=53360 RepID=UPI0031EED490